MIGSEALDMMRHDGSWEQKQEETTNKMRSNSREMGSLPKPFRMLQQEHWRIDQDWEFLTQGAVMLMTLTGLEKEWAQTTVPILLLLEKQIFFGCFDPTAYYKTKMSESKDHPNYRFILGIVCINKNCKMNNPIRLHHMGYFGTPGLATIPKNIKKRWNITIF